MSRSTPNTPDIPAAQTGESVRDGGQDAPVQRPLGVVIISIVLALEACALLAAGVWFSIGAFTVPQQSLPSTVFLIVIVFGLGAALAAVSVNVFKGFRWTRSAAFVWQLLMVAIAIPAFSSGAPVLGAVMLIPALVAAFYLFTPKVVAFTLRSSSQTPTL